MIEYYNKCSRFSDEKINDGVKTKKTFTLNNASGSTVINSEYLDSFQYTTNGSMIIAQALQQTDDNTLSAKTASEEEIFKEVEEDGPENIIPDNQIAMVLSFFPTAEGFYDYRKKQYIYQYKDHLGNVRSSYAKNKTSGVIEILDRNDYYPFGMNFYSYFGSAYDAKGTPFNYKYQEQELQETGFYAFKWRQYMPDVGRFFNIDPLSEKYAYQSHYNFSENKVTSHRELEGLEAISADNFNKNQSTLVVLGLGRANGTDGDGVGSGTNTLYSNLSKNLQTDGALASLQNSLGSNIAVATYTGTDSGLTATHMIQTISNYRSVNPDGKVIMIGHSAGGNDVLNAANGTNETINLVLTMDPVAVNAGGGKMGWGDYSSTTTKLNGNTQNIISLSSTDSYANGGGSRSNNDQHSISPTMPGTSHTNIDDSMTPYLKPLIQRTDQGVNPVKWFQNVNWSKFQVQPNVRTGNQEKKGTGSGS